MRILSKFKDYYDYVVTEPDNKKLYLRETADVVFNQEELIPNSTIYSKHSPRELKIKFSNTYRINEHTFISVIGFCDKLYTYFQHKNIIYFDYNDIPEEIIKKIHPKSKGVWNELKNYGRWHWFKNAFHDMIFYKRLGWVLDEHTKEPIKTNLNKLFNSPIVYVTNPEYNKIIINPKLSDLGFNKIISPTEAYQDIYNWIPYDEPEVPKSPEDMSRYEAKGFDKKTSFRPNMK